MIRVIDNPRPLSLWVQMRSCFTPKPKCQLLLAPSWHTQELSPSFAAPPPQPRRTFRGAIQEHVCLCPFSLASCYMSSLAGSISAWWSTLQPGPGELLGPKTTLKLAATHPLCASTYLLGPQSAQRLTFSKCCPFIFSH